MVALPKDRRNAQNIAHQLNKALTIPKIRTHIHIHRLNYNYKGNLSSLFALERTSSMLLSKHQKLVLKAVRQIGQDITDTTGDQR